MEDDTIPSAVKVVQKIINGLKEQGDIFIIQAAETKKQATDLQKLITTKTTISDQFARDRKILNDDSKQVTSDIAKAKSAYDKKANEKSKAKPNKVQEASDACYRAHNDYVLAVSAGNTLSTSAFENIMPRMLTAVEDATNFTVVDTRVQLSALVAAYDMTSETNHTLFNGIKEEIDAIDAPGQHGYLLTKFEDTPAVATLPSFEAHSHFLTNVDQSLSKGSGVFVTRSNLYGCDVQQDDIQAKIDRAEAEVAAKERVFADVQKEPSILSSLDDDANSDARSDAISEYIATYEAEFRLRRAEAELEKSRKQLDLITAGQGNTGDTEGYEDTPLNRETASPTPPPVVPRGSVHGKPSVPTPSTRKPPVPAPNEQKRPVPQPSAVPEGRPVEEESWFWGEKGRKEVEPYLQEVGDFLVRTSPKKSSPGEFNFVLSVCIIVAPKKCSHFIIVEDAGRFRFENDSYSTLNKLVGQYIRSQDVVTAKSQARIKTPMHRPGSVPNTDFGGGEGALRHEDVQIGKRLGKGNFGDVMLGTLVNPVKGDPAGTKVAIKTCRDSVPDPGRFIEEGDMLAEYDHPNIVKLIGVIATAPIMIVLELCTGGELLVFLREKGEDLDSGALVRMSWEGCLGMEYIHSKGTIHRDLAARNCLMSSATPSVLKISDFGMSRMTEGDEELYTVNTTAKQIPIKWTAPEALAELQYGRPSDVWSYGIMLWEMFSGGKMPYPGMNNAETKRQVIEKGYRMSKPDLRNRPCPQEMYDIMVECWNGDEHARPTFTELVPQFKSLMSVYPEEGHC